MFEGFKAEAGSVSDAKEVLQSALALSFTACWKQVATAGGQLQIGT